MLEDDIKTSDIDPVDLRLSVQQNELPRHWILERVPTHDTLDPYPEPIRPVSSTYNAYGAQRRGKRARAKVSQESKMGLLAALGIGGLCVGIITLAGSLTAPAKLESFQVADTLPPVVITTTTTYAPQTISTAPTTTESLFAMLTPNLEPQHTTTTMTTTLPSPPVRSSTSARVTTTRKRTTTTQPNTTTTEPSTTVSTEPSTTIEPITTTTTTTTTTAP